jgi:hypothetical protein
MPTNLIEHIRENYTALAVAHGYVAALSEEIAWPSDQNKVSSP